MQVSRLHRVRYGEFSLPRNLRRGKTQELTWRQINQLLKSVGLEEEARPDMRNHAKSEPSAKPKRRLVNPRKTVPASKPAGKGRKQLTIHDLSDKPKKRR